MVLKSMYRLLQSVGNFKKWLFIAILLRFFLMITTFHPDFTAFALAGFLISEGHIFDIYDYLFNLPSGHPFNSVFGINIFGYPPLALFFASIPSLIFFPLMDRSFQEMFLINPYQFFGNFSFETQLYLFLRKIHYLFFDFATLICLLKVVHLEKRKLVLLLWIFNPLVLLTDYSMGHFDIIPTFFVVFSLFLIFRNNPYFASLSLGIGAATKFFPFLFLPFIVLLFGKNFLEKIKLLLIGIFPFTAVSLPYLGSPIFRARVLASPESQKILFAGIKVAGADTLYIFIVGYIMILIFAIVHKANAFEFIWKYFFAVLLLFLAVTHFHPQWFLWITPLLILFVSERWDLWPMVAVFFVFYLGILLTFEPSLHYGLFVPLYPQLKDAPRILETIRTIYEPSLITSSIRSIFAAISISLIFITLGQMKIKLNQNEK